MNARICSSGSSTPTALPDGKKVGKKIINLVPQSRKKERNSSALLLSDINTIHFKQKQFHLSQQSLSYQGENIVKIYRSKWLVFSPLQKSAQSPVPDPTVWGKHRPLYQWLEFLHHEPHRKCSWDQGHISRLQPPSFSSCGRRLNQKHTVLQPTRDWEAEAPGEILARQPAPAGTTTFETSPKTPRRPLYAEQTWLQQDHWSYICGDSP